MSSRTLNFALLLGSLALPAPCRAQTKIPPFKGTSLAGTSVTLPADPGPALLIVGFSRKSTDDATLWGKRARVADASLPVYTLPLLADAPKLLRGMILHAMRGEAPPAVQPRFVPILDHVEEWKKAVGYDSPDAIYILLIDPGGAIRWRMEGPATDSAIAEMLRQARTIPG
ncbi:hypothetical protein SAMN05421770_101504 [Granulicella rosea]|uniref:ATP10 protein n=1 Tax=Granulicella rosea TaxID=474952 RepID=A0A239DKZ5_9BACT|nr:hypothetical protein [Granulicella rosea]SNS32512.1 hypothetical protein SAMN05421770_101504 [Granulicella rosea]